MKKMLSVAVMVITSGAVAAIPEPQNPHWQGGWSIGDYGYSDNNNCLNNERDVGARLIECSGSYTNYTEGSPIYAMPQLDDFYSDSQYQEVSDAMIDNFVDGCTPDMTYKFYRTKVKPYNFETSLDNLHYIGSAVSQVQFFEGFRNLFTIYDKTTNSPRQFDDLSHIFALKVQEMYREIFNDLNLSNNMFTIEETRVEKFTCLRGEG